MEKFIVVVHPVGKPTILDQLKKLGVDVEKNEKVSNYIFLTVSMSKELKEQVLALVGVLRVSPADGSDGVRP